MWPYLEKDLFVVKDKDLEMRSSWIRVGLKSINRCLNKKRKGEKTHRGKGDMKTDGQIRVVHL